MEMAGEDLWAHNTLELNTVHAGKKEGFKIPEVKPLSALSWNHALGS